MTQHIRYALVLSGGGFKAAFQAGVINYLQDHWRTITGRNTMRFDLVAGVSAGAVNGCLTAMNKLHELNMLWDGIGENGPAAVYDPNPHYDHHAPEIVVPKASTWQMLNWLFSPKKRKSYLQKVTHTATEQLTEQLHHIKALADSNPLLNKLRHIIQLKHILPGTLFSTGFVSLQSGRYHHALHTDFDDNEEFIKAILASTSLPMAWQPVPSIRTRHETIYEATDGSMAHTRLLGHVIEQLRRNALPETEYRLIIVDCNNEVADEDPEAANYDITRAGLRMMNEIAAAETFRSDLHQFFKTNHFVLQQKETPLYHYDPHGSEVAQPLKAIPYCLIRPQPGALGGSLKADNMITYKRIKHGWDQAAACFAQSQNVFRYTPATT